MKVEVHDKKIVITLFKIKFKTHVIIILQFYLSNRNLFKNSSLFFSPQD